MIPIDVIVRSQQPTVLAITPLLADLPEDTYQLRVSGTDPTHSNILVCVGADAGRVRRPPSRRSKISTSVTTSATLHSRRDHR